MLWESIYKRYVPGFIPPEEAAKAWWFIFDGNRMLVKISEDKAYIPFAESLQGYNIKPVRQQYMGRFDGYHCFSVEAVSGTEAPEGMAFMDLRSLYDLIEEDVFLLSGRAYQIVCWDQNHQFCGKCGAPTVTKTEERAKVCTKCGMLYFTKLCPAVIVAIIRDGRILLAHAKHFPANRYSIIAGFVEPGETFEECVKREVMEEVGIKVKNLKYFASQPWPFPNSLMVGFTAEYDEGEIKVDGVEITDAGWYSSNSLPDIPTKISIAGRLIQWFISQYS